MVCAGSAAEMCGREHFRECTQTRSRTRSWTRPQSSISIVLHLHPLIPNHSLSSSMTSIFFSPSLQPHPMNLSLPSTLTFISIILQTLTSQFLSSFNLSQHVHFPTHDKNHILDLVNLFRHLTCSGCFFHPTTFLSSPDSL